MRTILLVGEDALLLESRALLLRSTGAATITASMYQFARESTAEGVDVVVLCHTIPAALRAAMSEDARRRWPDIPVVQVLKNEFEAEPTLRHADGIVLSGEPAKLVRCASELLNRPFELTTPTPLETSAA